MNRLEALSEKSKALLDVHRRLIEIRDNSPAQEGNWELDFALKSIINAVNLIGKIKHIEMGVR